MSYLYDREPRQSRQEQHDFGLFSLLPVNKMAEAAVVNPSNSYLLYRLPKSPDSIYIGNVQSKKGTPSILATMGRQGDIVLTPKSISEIHCSFRLVPKPGPDGMLIMFVDESRNGSCKVSGKGTYPLLRQPGVPRQVVLPQGCKARIGIGGLNCNMFEFDVAWRGTANEIQDIITQRSHATLPENPMHARTVSDTETAVTSRGSTRMLTPSNAVSSEDSMPICVKKEGPPLGHGSFGAVFRGYNVHSGHHVAIKQIPAPGPSDSPVEAIRHKWRFLKREVENMRSCMHPHIVEFLGFNTVDRTTLEIYMALKEGNVYDLVLSPRHGLSELELADLILRHILQALDYLKQRQIFHRDIKPENILYHHATDGSLVLQLGDFGLRNRQAVAVSRSGSGIYMAPEIYEDCSAKGWKQSDKSDIWSLLVTFLWVTDYQDFRTTNWGEDGKLGVRRFIRAAISWNENVISRVKEMGFEDPAYRASAAQMLVKLYGGLGLTTPRRQIPALSPSSQTGHDLSNLNVFADPKFLVAPPQYQAPLILPVPEPETTLQVQQQPPLEDGYPKKKHDSLFSDSSSNQAEADKAAGDHQLAKRSAAAARDRTGLGPRRDDRNRVCKGAAAPRLRKALAQSQVQGHEQAQEKGRPAEPEASEIPWHEYLNTEVLATTAEDGQGVGP